MNVPEIASRAGVPVSRVKYVLTHRVMPGLRGRRLVDRPGQPWTFLETEAFSLAIAALLHNARLQRSLVVDVLRWLVETPWPPAGVGEAPPTPLERAVGRPKTAFDALYSVPDGTSVFRVGDGVALRLLVGANDTGWFDPRARALYGAEYAPRVMVELDLSKLRVAFKRAD
jgi:hypothetical protein